ncbi:MAG: endonuclease MutS2, partial [Brevinematia bacterium]
MNQWLKDLEFDKLLEEISSFCITKEGRELVLSIEPLTYHSKYSESIQLISYRHSQISKAILILSKVSVPEIPYDTLDIWKKASKEGTLLLPKQIYTIYEFLLKTVEILRFISDLDAQFSVIRDLISSVDVDEIYKNFKELENAVIRSIDRDGNIIRTATERLDRIISEKEKLELMVVRILSDFINDPQNEEFLQERFVTIRNNRFVIPVKMEYVNAIDGFVQDISSTGHTAFVEPRFVQSYSIRYLELVEEEKEEIEKILRDISRKVGRFSDSVDLIISTLGRIDFIFSLAKYAQLTNSSRPKLSSKPIVKLVKARHPFLKNPVPIDIEVGNGENDFGGLIISGPNTSGKTVSIKTVGLLAVMALSGMLIPASEESVIGYFNKILADIGDPQSIEKDLSTFSAHIIKINDIVRLADVYTLVIIDEIGTGTDPREGEALAVAILKYLASKKSKIFVATHFSLVKKLPLHLDYFKNAYMEFDEDNLKPTYRLVMGLSGSSNAILIAQKLGLLEEITTQALRIIAEGIDIHEKFMVEIQIEKREVEKLKEELKEKISEIEKIKKEYKSKMIELESKLEKVRKKEFDSILSEIYKLKSKVSEIRNRIMKENITQKEL